MNMTIWIFDFILNSNILWRFYHYLLLSYLLAKLFTDSFIYIFFICFFFFFSGRNKEQIMKLEVTKKQKQFFFSKKDNACLFIVASPYTLICHCIQNLHSVIQLLKFCVFPVNYLFLQCCMHPICSMCWNNFRRCYRHFFEYQNKDVM